MTRNTNSFEELANAIQNIISIYKQFYITYPQMVHTASDYIQLNDYQSNIIFQSLTEQFTGLPAPSTKELLNKISFDLEQAI